MPQRRETIFEARENCTTETLSPQATNVVPFPAMRGDSTSSARTWTRAAIFEARPRCGGDDDGCSGSNNTFTIGTKQVVVHKVLETT